MALITVIGASGRQGMAQVRQALKAGYDVRAISRQEDPFGGAKIDGVERVEVRPMDLYDSATFAGALQVAADAPARVQGPLVVDDRTYDGTLVISPRGDGGLEVWGGGAVSLLAF